jgi:hypothetical protein
METATLCAPASNHGSRSRHEPLSSASDADTLFVAPDVPATTASHDQDHSSFSQD